MATNHISASNTIIIIAQILEQENVNLNHTIEAHADNISDLVNMMNQLKNKVKSHDNHNIHHYFEFMHYPLCCLDLVRFVFIFISRGKRIVWNFKLRLSAILTHAISIPRINQIQEAIDLINK